MLRYLAVICWVLVFALLLLRFKVHLISGLAARAMKSPPAAQQAAPPAEAKDAEDFVLSFVKDWDFDRFYAVVHPDLKRQIPADGLKTLFEGLAEKLGPLEQIYDSREESNGGTLSVLLDAGFSQGRCRIEAELEKTDRGYRVRRFAAESPALEQLNTAAEEAYRDGHFNQSLFNQKFHAP